jgi:hypothetical protein
MSDSQPIDPLAAVEHQVAELGIAVAKIAMALSGLHQQVAKLVIAQRDVEIAKLKEEKKDERVAAD